MLLSIIVPVYNIAPYLRKCVDSLLARDYDDYEIILVDDGSTDDSGAICDEYATKLPSLQGGGGGRPQIRVLHQSHIGPGGARNSGVSIAEGRYIQFVDSDDYLEPNVLGALLEQVEREQLDVLRFGYQNVRVKNEGVRELGSEGEYEVFEPNKYPRPIQDYTDIVSGEKYLNERMGYACYAWQFIIKRSIVNSFESNIYFEDVEWLPRMMLAAKRVNSVATVAYNYFWRKGSISHTQGNVDMIFRNEEDYMTIISRYNALIAQNPDCYWLFNMRSSMALGVLSTIARYLYPQRKNYISRLKALDVFPVSIADQGYTYVRRARLLNGLGPRLYCVIMHIHFILFE